MTGEISRIEMIWNETQMFRHELLNPKWLDKNWKDLPRSVQEAFASLVSEDVPRSEFFR